MFQKIGIWFLISLSFFVWVQANDTCETKCTIYEQTPDVLLDYIQEMRAVVRNITTHVRTQQNQTWLDRDVSRLKNSIVRGYNLVSSWNGYYSYFKFYVTYSTTNEYIPEIWRDYDLLNLETKWLERYIKSISQRGLSNITIDKNVACNGITTNCDFSGNVLDVLIALNGNHEKVKEHFRKSILWEVWQDNAPILLTQTNFYTDFRKHYNENTTKNCSTCNGWYWTRIQETMERVNQNMENADTWIQEWKTAWDLLVGWVDASEAQKIERDLLRRELGRQWVSAEQGNKILQNLDNFNQNWLSWMMSNNFISNSFDYFAKMITPQINEFDETVLQSFRDEMWKEREVVSIADLNKTSQNISNTTLVQQRIAELYQKELSGLAVWDRSINETVSKLIEMHYDISKSVEYLDKASKLFEAVCLYQANWEWKCN